mgnify:CR=1 FL=1
MRVNLTKKDLINSIYLQIGISKKVIELLLDNLLNIIVENLKKKYHVKCAKHNVFYTYFKEVFNILRKKKYNFFYKEIENIAKIKKKFS